MCYDIADINRLSDGFDSRYLLSDGKPWKSKEASAPLSHGLFSFRDAITEAAKPL